MKWITPERPKIDCIGADLRGGSGLRGLGFKYLHPATYWLADHAHGPAATLPILVMDMYDQLLPNGLRDGGEVH